MAGKMVSLRIDPDLLARVDAVAGAGGRTAWMVRALESALADDTQRPSPAGREVQMEAASRAARPPAASPRGASRPSASSRASGPTRLDSTEQVRSWMAERQARLNASKERAS